MPTCCDNYTKPKKPSKSNQQKRSGNVENKSFQELITHVFCALAAYDGPRVAPKCLWWFGGFALEVLITTFWWFQK